MTLTKSKLSILITPLFIFIISLYLVPYYISGDQVFYIDAYTAIRNLGFLDGYMYYYRALSTLEPLYYILIYISSPFFEKYLFVSISNAILAYYSVRFFTKLGSRTYIASIIVLTNFYFYVLFFSAERLKFGFIFLTLSLIYVNSPRFFYFSILSVVTHTQMMILYLAVLFRNIVGDIFRLIYFNRVRKSTLVGLVIILIVSFFLFDHIYSRFVFYFSKDDPVRLEKLLVFFILAQYYSTKRMEILLVFIALSIAIFFVGDERINIFGYFIFLYYALQVKGGLNLGVLITSIYFAYKSILFINNIINHGNGFFR